MGDSDLGGNGKGLLRFVVFLGEAGDDGFAKDVEMKLGPGGDDDKLSNETV